jgi:hypothetical protein
MHYIRSFMQEMGYEFIAEGRMRATYRSPNKRFVLKFPKEKWGLDGNISEAKRYSTHKNNPDPENHGAVYAPCRLIQGAILMMWAVEKSYGTSGGCIEALHDGKLSKLNRKEAPHWVQFLDCDQAGILPNGRVVAFDYTVGC